MKFSRELCCLAMLQILFIASMHMAAGLGFSSQSSYLQYLQSISHLPQGFSVGSARFPFRPFEVDKELAMNLTVIVADKPSSSFAAMFTSNQFPGGPILVGRERMKTSQQIQAIVVNNKISNVCPGRVSDRGVGDSERVCEGVASTFALPSKDLVLPSSTGIIGWRLPVDAIVGAMPLLKSSLQSESILPAAVGITTTDRYPKVRSVIAKNSKWRVVGIAKGAGMIEPNMATMLAYVLTDLKLPKASLEKCFRSAVGKSFNCISVDGDQSTSDTAFILSSEIVECSQGDEEEFQTALNEVCLGLAEDIVRNGEGTNHVIKATVTGAPSDIVARNIGRFVCNSNLVKCAIAGCDPNVGRIVGAIGSYLGTIDGGPGMTKGLKVTLGGVDIFDDGAFQLDPVKEKQLSDYMLNAQLYPDEIAEHDRLFPMHSRCVELEIKLNYDSKASGRSVVIGSDLTKEYVDVNADYRS